MSELSGHDCPRCNVELFIEASEDAEGVDLLICKQCWGVGVTAKSMALVMAEGSLLDQNREQMVTPKSSGDCKCPLCSEIMDEIDIKIPDNIYEKISMIEGESETSTNVIIDSCNSCPTFWFDAGELDLLNGIKPKLRGAEFDSKKVRLLEDQTLSPEDLKNKRVQRQFFGGFAILAALGIGFTGNPLMSFFAILIGIGGLIAILTKNPEQALVTGTCDKCLEEDKLLAWNCQSGGCWAHICTDCQSVGDDPVEAYARTLGQVAVGTVVVGVGIFAVLATDGMALEGVGAVVEAPIGSSSSKKKSNMLLCKECTDRIDRTNEKHVKKNKKIKGKVKTRALKDIIPDGYCTHIDPVTNKKCKRMDFRDSGLCYVHK